LTLLSAGIIFYRMRCAAGRSVNILDAFTASKVKLKALASGLPG
jgi:hypothetical protein